jgi:predicted metalloprotease
MVVPRNAERTEERRRAPLWGAALAGAIALCIVGARASAAFRDVRVPSAEPSRGPGSSSEPMSAADRTELEAFADSTAKDVDAIWARDFRRRSKPYAHAEPVLLDAPGKSECGPGIDLARSDCLGTNKAFIDLSFQRALASRFENDAGGAKAYAIAHELGHHVQRVLGID